MSLVTFVVEMFRAQKKGCEKVQDAENSSTIGYGFSPESLGLQFVLH
jgi:hypothetical protein